MANERPRIQIVEDDPRIAGLLSMGLSQAGYRVSVADALPDVRGTLRAGVDLFILDLNLPTTSGFHILEAIRQHSEAPVLVLTARTDLEDRLRAFELGASDYVAKPFFVQEVIARVAARLGPAAQPEPVRFADILADPQAKSVHRAAELLQLTPYERELLFYLVERAGRAVPRSALAEGLVQGKGEADVRGIDAHMSKLRRKLGPEGAAHLRTVRGVGYRFDASRAP